MVVRHVTVLRMIRKNVIRSHVQWMASGSLGVAGAPVTSRVGAEYAYVTVLVTFLSLAGSHVKARKKTRAVVTIFHVQSMVSGTPGQCGTIAVRFAEAEISLDIVLVMDPTTAD